MCRMVMKYQVMIDDSMVGMIQFQKMFQCSCSLVMLGLDVVYFYGLDVYGGAVATAEEARKSKGI